VRFPRVPSMPFASYMPRVWRLDYGAGFASGRVIANEPPSVGAPYRVLVPQVNADGNDMGGIRLPEVAVPLGTYTGWNVTVPQLADLRYLGGLVGGFEPFARTKDGRERSGDTRRSIAERYTGPQDYLDEVRRSTEVLVRDRFMLAADVPAVVDRAREMWDAIVTVQTPR
jgi:hypothetical protein